MSNHRAAVLNAPGQITFTERTTPMPARGEVLVELTAVGVCGSDVHWFEEGHIGDVVLDEPLTLGHEPAGVVRAVGEGVDRALVGRRVAVEPAIHCGVCRFCAEGDTNICPNVRFMGTPPTQGAFQQLLAHPAHLIAPLPDAVSDEVGALLEPLAIGVHIADLLRPRLGVNIVIQGAGPIGLSALLALRLAAPENLIVVEPLAYRRELATELGATHTFDCESPDVVDEVRRLTGGYGADYVVEAVGTPESFARMVDFAQPGAQVAVAGIEPNDRFGCSCGVARRKGLTFHMVRRSRHTLERAIAMTVGGYWHPEAMVTHRRGLDALGPTMQTLSDYADGIVKAIVDPRA